MVVVVVVVVVVVSTAAVTNTAAARHANSVLAALPAASLRKSFYPTPLGVVPAVSVVPAR